MEISVIIPIYKTEEYIKECIDSILTQAHEDVEVILVDDGSPDNCPLICDEYAAADPRVKVVHKENGGLSSARNAGLAVAQGRYVTFVDSDDVICAGSFPKILEWTKNESADICFLKAEKIFPDGTRQDLGECIASEPLRGRPREEAIAYLASRPKYPGSAWTKLFRREFLVENDLHFPYDRRYSEDVGFIRDCVLHASGFDALEIPFYQYRQNRQGSITNTVSTRNFYDLFRFITESVQKLTVDKKAKDSVCKLVMSFAAYEYSILLYLYHRLPIDDKKDALLMLKKYRWVMEYSFTRKGKLISLVCRLFGIKFTSFLMNKYRRAAEK